MAEDKRSNPFPYPTATEVLAAPGSQAEKAARNIVTRHIEGIPKRAYILGQNDHAPVLKGVKDLTTLCYRVLDEYAEDSNAHPLLLELRDMLEHHGCPDTAPIPTNEG